MTFQSEWKQNTEKFVYINKKLFKNDCHPLRQIKMCFICLEMSQISRNNRNVSYLNTDALTLIKYELSATIAKCCTFKHRLRDSFFVLHLFSYTLLVSRLNVQCSDALLDENRNYESFCIFSKKNCSAV